LFTKLPWANIEAKADNKKMKKECLRLANHEDSLLKLLPQLEYAFEFDFEKYVFLATVMPKFFPDLSEVRLRLVPDEVSDSEFWRNYFYHIELFKLQQGFENRLGVKIDEY